MNFGRKAIYVEHIETKIRSSEMQTIDEARRVVEEMGPRWRIIVRTEYFSVVRIILCIIGMCMVLWILRMFLIVTLSF